MITVPVTRYGYVQWVWPTSVRPDELVFLYGEDFNSPYCPIQYEVQNDAV